MIVWTIVRYAIRYQYQGSLVPVLLLEPLRRLLSITRFFIKSGAYLLRGRAIYRPGRRAVKARDIPSTAISCCCSQRKSGKGVRICTRRGHRVSQIQQAHRQISRSSRVLGWKDRHSWHAQAYKRQLQPGSWMPCICRVCSIRWRTQAKCGGIPNSQLSPIR